MSESQYQPPAGGAGGGQMGQPMQQPPPPPPGYGYGGGMMGMRRMGGGFGGPRRDYPIETKPFFLTSEFLAFIIGTIALAITAAADNSIDSRFFWILETVLISFYMLARGLAKAGTKSRSADPREDLLRSAGDSGTHQH